jgi:uncharacterized protein (TIGR03032 family)
MSNSPAEMSSPVYHSVRFEYSESLVRLLEYLNGCLLISNYHQGGQVLVVGVFQGQLSCTFHAFEHALGMAVRPNRIAVGTQRRIYFLHSAPDLASQLPPSGMFDTCYLSRKSHVTGEILAHEMGWSGDQLWVVNTAFSCLCTLDEEYSFIPRWLPPFISSLGPEDRCHLNGLAMAEGRPRYVTALGEADEPQGWRATKIGGGCVIDVEGRCVVARGFAMPHSPRVHDGRLWVLESARGRLMVVDPVSGRSEPVVALPGFTRGMCLVGPYAFIGLSTLRTSSALQGFPLMEQNESLHCGVRVVDLRTGEVVAGLDFPSGVDEIFGVEILPGVRLAALVSPNPQAEGRDNVWYLPALNTLTLPQRG